MTTNPQVFNMILFMDTPPQFDGDRFELWKVRFENVNKAVGFRMWDILNNGLFMPTFL